MSITRKTLVSYFETTTVPQLQTARLNREEAALRDTTAWIDFASQLIGVNVNVSQLSRDMAASDAAMFEHISAGTIRKRVDEARRLLKAHGNDAAAFWSAVDDLNDDRDLPVYSIQTLARLMLGDVKPAGKPDAAVSSTFVLDGTTLGEITDLGTLEAWMDAIADRIQTVKGATPLVAVNMAAAA